MRSIVAGATADNRESMGVRPTGAGFTIDDCRLAIADRREWIADALDQRLMRSADLQSAFEAARSNAVPGSEFRL